MERLARILLLVAALLLWGGGAQAATPYDGCRPLSGGRMYLCDGKSAPYANTTQVNSSYGIYKHEGPDGKVYYYNHRLPPTFRDKLGGQCWTCAFVGAFVGIADAFVGASIRATSPLVSNLLNYLAALWLLLQGVRLVFPGQVPVARTLKDLVVRSLVLMTAFAALSQGGEILFVENVYIPALSMPTEIAAQLTQKAASVAGGGLPTPSSCGGYTALPVTAGAATSPAISSVISSIVCQIHTVQQVNIAGLALGEAVYSPPSLKFWEVASTFIPNLLAAAALTCVFGISLICFPFYIIDALFRITFLASFAPIFIACACFLPTRRYALAALTGALQAGVRIVGIGVVYALASAMLSYAAELSRPAGYAGTWTLEIMVDAFNGQTIANLPSVSEGYGFGQGAFWYMLMAGLMVLVVARSAAGMLSQIFTLEGGGGADYGAGLGEAAQGLAGTGVRGAFAAGMVPVAWGVGKAGNFAGKTAATWAAHGGGYVGGLAAAGFDQARRASPGLDMAATALAKAADTTAGRASALGDAVGAKVDAVRSGTQRALISGLEAARDSMVDEGRDRVDELIRRLSGKWAIPPKGGDGK